MLKASRFAFGLLLPLTLAACSTPSAPTTPAAFYGDGLDHSWTANAQEGQQLYSALSNGLKAQGVDMGVTLDITASNGWGPIEVNQSNGETAAGDGKPITLKGKTYTNGLGVHGDSEIHIKATGLVTPACTHFKADIGIDDEVGANGKYSSVVFQVFADGEKLYDSGLVTGSTPTKSIDIPVGNKSDLRFVVTHGPDMNYYDHADWAGATLSCKSLTLNTDSLDIYHLHSNTLQATFSGYPAGPVQLRLVADPLPPRPIGYPALAAPDLILNTTTAVLSGAASQTVPLTISAPKTVYYSGGSQVPTGNFHIITTVNGVDVDSVPVTLTELQLHLSSHFEPSAFSAPVNSVQNLILVTTVDPPLDGPVPITVGYNSPIYNANIDSYGTTTGTGAEMRTPVQVKVMDYFQNSTPVTTTFAVNITGVADGYRDVWYGNDSVADLTVTSIPTP